MANKRKITSGKNNIGANVNATPETKEQNTADIFEKYWPKSFASPRRTVFLVAASLLTAAIVFPTASVGGFTAFKISLAELLNLTTPELVSPANYDVACVLWAMTTVLFMGLVHPCLGIGVLLLLRPWLDGIRFFPTMFILPGAFICFVFCG